MSGHISIVVYIVNVVCGFSVCLLSLSLLFSLSFCLLLCVFVVTEGITIRDCSQEMQVVLVYHTEFLYHFYAIDYISKKKNFKKADIILSGFLWGSLPAQMFYWMSLIGFNPVSQH